MSTVLHYKSNLRDVFFNLFEVHDVANTTLAHEVFSHLDEATCRQMLTELYKLCETELAASYAADDREGVRFDGQGNVTLPEGLSRNIRTFRDGGWPLLGLPEHMGGIGAPPSVAWGSGKCPACVAARLAAAAGCRPWGRSWGWVRGHPKGHLPGAVWPAGPATDEPSPGHLPAGTRLCARQTRVEKNSGSGSGVR